MTKKVQKWVVIGAFTLVVGLIVANKVKMKKQASLLEKLIPFVEQWEGGLSRKTSDTASSHPAPWVYNGESGWHTNKGVTYSTFVSLASQIGYAITPENFFNMSNDLWIKILKVGFMAPYPLERINHLPRIQAVIITWAWGSGLSGSERRLANFQREEMGIKDSNITKAEIVENFRNMITRSTELMWFYKLCARRASDFKKMSTYAFNGRGWLRRLSDFKRTFE